MNKPKIRKQSLLLLSVIICAFYLAVLYGCGNGPDSGTPPTPTGPIIASINLSATPTTVKSDGSTTTTITVNALNASNAALSDVTVTMSTSTGVLGAPSVVTSSTTPATVTFYSPGNPINRTATITATANNGAVTAQIPIQIVGSTITLTTSGTTLPSDGSATVTLTVTAKDAGGNVVPNAAVALTQTGTGGVSITPASGTTNSSGAFTATVAGVATGAATLTATGLGATATKDVTVTAGAATSFAIDQLKLNGVVIANDTTTAMKTTDTLEVRVNAPSPTANVIFATTTGVWNATSSAITVPVVAGKAIATLTTTQAGIANVQVYDAANPATSDTLTVAMTSGAAAYKISIQATPTVVPKSVGTTTGSAILIATVQDAGGFPIGGVPVLFSLVNPTGGGENVAPVVVLTATTISGGLGLGEARASFTSGSSPSTTQGVKIRASVVGTTVQTGASPSSNDASIVIGGVAGSVAFGMATSVGTNDNATQYILPMSVLVADANGNPVSGAIVSLGAWPEAWSTGTRCWPDADYISTYDYSTTPPTETRTYGNYGTFRNEDANENLFLDLGEDGKRTYYSGANAGKDAYTDGFTTIPPKKDGFLTPTNSAGGTVPSMVTTQANGVATFNLTYPKISSIWTLSRIRASVIVSGSETVGQIIFRLRPSLDDVTYWSDGTVLECFLGNSPYWF